MPEDVNATASQPQVETWDPPGGDVGFDELFPGGDAPAPRPTTAEEEKPAPAPAQEPQAEPAPAPVQEPEKKPEFLLKTDTGTVYKSLEEAKRGTEEKDKIIEQMRKMLQAGFGLDPLTQKPATVQPVSYLRDSNQYARDLSTAAEKQDFDRYKQVQLQLINEYLTQVLAPYLPVVEKVGQQEALESMTNVNKDFRSFYSSQDYTKVLEDRPKLKEAIEYAERTPQARDALKELYQIAYDVNFARKATSLLQQPKAVETPPQPRPTAASTHLTPVPAIPTAKPGLETSAGRKALIKELEDKGIKDFQF